MPIDTAPFALITAGVAGGTLAQRALFIFLAGRQQLPPRMMQALSFVPASIFTGLIVALVHPERVALAGDPALLRIIALCIAAVVALRTRSILWTIIGGMCAMWLLAWLFSLFGR